MAAGAAPNIELMKNASPTSGAPSTNLTFTIDVMNSGDVSFSTVSITDLLPEGLSFIESSSQPPADNVSPNQDGTTTISWDNVSPSGLDPGNTSPVSFQAHIDGVDRSGEESFGYKTNGATATASADGIEAVTKDASVTVLALKPEIRATKTVNQSEASPLSGLEFTLRITNTGNATFKAVRVADILSAGLSYVSDNRSGNVEENIVTWTVNEPLLPGESLFISMIAMVDANARGTLTDQVGAIGIPENGDPVINTNTDNTATVKVIREEAIKPADTNRDILEIGNDFAQAFGASIFGTRVSQMKAAQATNDLEIAKNQDTGDCKSCLDSTGDCSDYCIKLNIDQIKVRNRDATSMGSGASKNHVKIVTNQV